jgi:small-conductance mechanosensitive channel
MLSTSGYLDTTLWEFGGQYLSTDHPSGRLIKFPNEKVLDELVYNYSWPLFPYIWNEVKFQIGYNADLEFIASTMQKITEEELGRERSNAWKPSRLARSHARGRIGGA